MTSTQTAPGERQSVMARREHWRRVHLEADRRRPLPELRRLDQKRKGIVEWLISFVRR